ncbi:MAG: hypothetical protein JRG90_07280, partial [Deltaproteobacteria bacterium]|nr:hypothetical protein [Deltaproteobacteria bacterium]
MDPTSSEATGLLSALETIFTDVIVAPLSAVIFLDVWFWDNAGGDEIQVPLVVLWLILGATFFTLRFQFVN